MPNTTVDIRITDLPEFKEAIAELKDEIAALKLQLRERQEKDIGKISREISEQAAQGLKRRGVGR